MEQGLRHRVALLAGVLALLLTDAASAWATDRVFIESGGVYDFAPCTVSVTVPVYATMTVPVRAMYFSYRLQDELQLLAGTESRFTGAYTRGSGVPDSIFTRLFVTLNGDSTVALIGLEADVPATLGIEAHLLDLKVLAVSREAIVGLSIFPDTLFSGEGPSFVDTAGVPGGLLVEPGWFQTFFDEFPPRPGEAVYGSYQKIERMREDTTVNLCIYYYAHLCYESISIPIRVKPSGIDAFIVPGSIEATEWAGPDNHRSFDLTPFPDSTGFWLHLFGGPSSRSYYADPFHGQPIVCFDLKLSGAGPGVVMIDTALESGVAPLEFVDACPHSYRPGFSPGRVDVGAVAVFAEETPLPAYFELENPYPNPFNAATTIGVRLAEPAAVRLEIVNLLGRSVATIWNGRLSAGVHEFHWSADAAASGLYLVRAQSAMHYRTAKLLLLK